MNMAEDMVVGMAEHLGEDMVDKLHQQNQFQAAQLQVEDIQQIQVGDKTLLVQNRVVAVLQGLVDNLSVKYVKIIDCSYHK